MGLMLIPVGPWQLAHSADFAFPAAASPAIADVDVKINAVISAKKRDFIWVLYRLFENKKSELILRDSTGIYGIRN